MKMNPLMKKEIMTRALKKITKKSTALKKKKMKMSALFGKFIGSVFSRYPKKKKRIRKDYENLKIRSIIQRTPVSARLSAKICRQHRVTEASQVSFINSEEEFYDSIVIPRSVGARTCDEIIGESNRLSIPVRYEDEQRWTMPPSMYELAPNSMRSCVVQRPRVSAGLRAKIYREYRVTKGSQVDLITDDEEYLDIIVIPKSVGAWTFYDILDECNRRWLPLRYEEQIGWIRHPYVPLG